MHPVIWILPFNMQHIQIRLNVIKNIRNNLNLILTKASHIQSSQLLFSTVNENICFLSERRFLSSSFVVSLSAFPSWNCHCCSDWWWSGSEAASRVKCDTWWFSFDCAGVDALISRVIFVCGLAATPAATLAAATIRVSAAWCNRRETRLGLKLDIFRFLTKWLLAGRTNCCQIWTVFFALLCFLQFYIITWSTF